MAVRQILLICCPGGTPRCYQAVTRSLRQHVLRLLARGARMGTLYTSALWHFLCTFDCELQHDFTCVAVKIRCNSAISRSGTIVASGGVSLSHATRVRCF